jgi:hypothetical protein
MLKNIRPTPEDTARSRRWNQWRDDVFSEVAKSLGETDTKGAHRTFGDFVVNCDATYEMGVAMLWVCTDPNKALPQLGFEAHPRWEEASPARAAIAVLEMCEQIRRHFMYVLAKRARDSNEI